MRNLLINLSVDGGLDLDRDDRRRVDELLNDAVGSNRGLLLRIILGVLVMTAIGFTLGIGLVSIMGAIGATQIVSILVAAIGTPLTLLGVWFMIFPRLLRPEIRRALRACGFDVCHQCGYRLDVHGDDEPCPECGTTTQPPLGERDAASE